MASYNYDLFISYAVEDRIIVTELVDKLEKSGLRVWYANQELRVGRSIQKLIKEGLNKSKHAVLILSHDYFTKDWPKKEFHALWGKENFLIIPVWYHLSTEEMQKYDPFLADMWGIEAGQNTDYVVEKIKEAINQKPTDTSQETEVLPKRKLSFKHYLGILSFLILASLAIWYFLIRDLPSNNLINSTITDRMDTFQEQIMTTHDLEMKNRDGKAATIQEIKEYYNHYNDIKAQYRNEYEFDTGYKTFSFKKNVEPVLGVTIDLLTPDNKYGFTYPNMFAIDYMPSNFTIDVKYIFINTQKPKFEITDEEKTSDSTYLVDVAYENYIRYLSVDLTYSKRSDWMKHRQKTFKGFLPHETYRFKKQDEDWVFVGLE